MFWRRRRPEPSKEDLLWNERILRRWIQDLDRYPPYAILAASNSCLCELYRLEPLIPQRLEEDLYRGFMDFFEALPPSLLVTWDDVLAETARRENDPEFSSSQMTVPLYDLVPKIGKAVLDVCAPVCWREAMEAGVFSRLRRQVLENEARASGIHYSERRYKKVIGSDEYDGTPYEIVETYCAHTPFYQLFTFPVPFRIGRSIWSSHAVCLAPPKFGKSQLLALLLREALEDSDPRAIILLDPHGDLFSSARTRVPPERLVIIDPDTRPPDLNLLDFGTFSEHDALETFKFLMSSLAGGLSPKQETCIPSLFELLKKIDGANFVTLHEIISERPKKGAPSKFADAVKQLEPVHRDFFEDLFYTSNFQETRDALQWKMLAALSRPAFRKMFSARRNSIDVSRFIEERKVVLVKGGERSLGKEGMRIFLLFLVGQYYAAGKRRDAIPERRRHLAMMLVDEAHMVLESPLISDILVELRKYQCAFMAATQVWHQVAENVRPAVLGATAIKIVGAVQHNDAVVLSRDMYTTPDFLRDMTAVEGSHAEWAIHVAGATGKRAIKVRCPYGVLEAMPEYAVTSTRAIETPVDDEQIRSQAATDVPVNRSQERSDPSAVREQQSGPPGSSGDGDIKPGKGW